MHLFSHGGHCCGISTLWGFDEAPDCKIAKWEAQKPPPGNQFDFTRCRDIGASYNYPEQTYAERAEALIKTVAGERPKGLIEAVLTTGKYSYDHNHYRPEPQIDVWGPVLEKLGFVPVTTFRNSNSGCDVTVYHYAYGQ